MMRTAAQIDNGHIINVLVLPDGAAGDAMLNDSCVEITSLDPKPGVGNGWTFVDGTFAPPPVPPLTWDDVRAERDSLLSASDWTQMPDNALDAPTIAAWAAYRQALRDIPQTQDDPDSIVWPEAP